MKARDAFPLDAAAMGEAAYPCAPAQRRFWILEQMAPRDPALNVALRWEIVGAVQPAQIERALALVVERHETLRTRLVEEDGEPVQKVGAAAHLRFATIDLVNIPAPAREARAAEIAAAEACVGFDVARAPLARFTLLRFEPARSWLLLTFHHAVFDGGSIDVMLRDFAQALDAVLAGRDPGFAPLALQYGDYAAWLQAVEASGALTEGRAYWREALRDAPTFDLPADRPRVSGRRPSKILASTLDAPLAEAMEARARALGMTLFALNCAALAALLAAAADQRDVVFSTQASGRDQIELEPLIGVFVNNLVLRFDAAPQATLEAFAHTVDARLRAALGHADVPFGDLVEMLHPRREPGRAPLATINFTLLGTTRARAETGADRVRKRPSFSPGAQYDLNFFLVHWPEGWRMALEYDATLFDAPRAEALLEAWRASLVAMVSGEGSLGALMQALRRTLPAPPLAETRAPAPPAPRDDVREAVAAIWRDALGAAEIGPDSDFFALGGQSLLAIRVAARVAAAVGAQVNVMDLFRAPRFADFMATLNRAADDDWRVTPIGRTTGAPTIFAFHNSFAYRRLAERLAGRHDLIGLQLFDPHARTQLADRSIEAIATDYVGLIRARQPHGPYRLIGLCVAGVVAYEVARRLEAEGETVEALTLLDCVAPGALARLAPMERARVRWSYRWLVARRHFADWRAGKALTRILAHYRALRPLVGRAESAEEDETPWFLPALERTRAAYRPRAITAPTLIAHSDELDIAFARRGLGWRPHLTGPMRVIHAPGWHTRMLDDGVARVAAAMLHEPMTDDAPASAP